MAFAPILGTIVSVLGTGVGIVGAIGMANYQSKVAEMNAKIAQDNAQRAVERSRIEAMDQDIQTRGMLGAQEAAQSASGVSLNSPSFILTRKAARTLGRRDTLNVIQGGQIEKYNYLTDAVNQQAAGRGAKAQGYADALGIGLSGVGNLVGQARPSAKSGTLDPWVTKSGKSLRGY